MNDRFGGAVQKGVGQLQDTIGGLTGETKAQARGAVNQSVGSVQEALGYLKGHGEEVFEEAEGYVQANPLLASAGTLFVGILVGAGLRGVATTRR